MQPAAGCRHPSVSDAVSPRAARIWFTGFLSEADTPQRSVLCFAYRLFKIHNNKNSETLRQSDASNRHSIGNVRSPRVDERYPCNFLLQLAGSALNIFNRNRRRARTPRKQTEIRGMQENRLERLTGLANSSLSQYTLFALSANADIVTDRNKNHSGTRDIFFSLKIQSSPFTHPEDEKSQYGNEQTADSKSYSRSESNTFPKFVDVFIEHQVDKPKKIINRPRKP